MLYFCMRGIFCMHGIFLQSCELSRQQTGCSTLSPSPFWGLAQPGASSPPTSHPQAGVTTGPGPPITKR